MEREESSQRKTLRSVFEFSPATFIIIYRFGPGHNKQISYTNTKIIKNLT